MSRYYTSATAMTSEEDSSATAAEEILSLTQEALELASFAIRFDREDNFVCAYDYYDKALLNIDEVMSKLPRHCAQWTRLMETRCAYDERLYQLREMERDRSSVFGSARSSLSTSTDTTTAPTLTSQHTHTTHTQEECNFVEMDLSPFVYEPPPQDKAQIPFWLLRNVQRTIEDGGFLTEALFVPSRVWQQSDVKFSGHNVKMAALEIVLSVICTHVDPLAKNTEEKSLRDAEDAFARVAEELLSLQNQIAKSFHFVKENKNGSEGEDNGVSMEINTGKDSPVTSGSSKSWAKYMASVGKNVKKYAEVSLSRIAAAMPSKISSEELKSYRQRICAVCEASQIIASWHRFVRDLLQTMTTIQNPIKKSENDNAKQEIAGILTPDSYLRLDNIDQSLWTISMVMKEVVCEILLRDVEQMLEKHMTKSRKSYSRMHWDQDQNVE